MYVKVKELMFFDYDSVNTVNKCHIIMRPQQKWEVAGRGAGFYTIERKGIVMKITKDDFDKYFEEWE